MKALTAVMWFSLGLAGIYAWRDRSWAEIAVPIVSFVLVTILIRIGFDVVGWTLGIGYRPGLAGFRSLPRKAG